jgi:adenylate cyclase, class 2
VQFRELEPDERATCDNGRVSHLNVEIKARCADPEAVRAALRGREADLRGLDRQSDTYFRCATGRLKLREGNIESSLIHYARADQAGPKESHVTMCAVPPGGALRPVLEQALGVLVTVRKRREIWFVGNVKLHVDDVDGLGSFVEIEAIDADGTIGRERLQAQCAEFMALLRVHPEDLLAQSYSDMLLDCART